MKTSVIEKDDRHKAVKAESGLLLDRAKLAAFIKEQKVNDSTAALLRSIYKNRNYQVAWFTESGIAENTRAFWTLHNNYIHNFGDTALLFDALQHEIKANTCSLLLLIVLWPL